MAIAYIQKDVLQALEYLHTRCIIHRLVYAKYLVLVAPWLVGGKAAYKTIGDIEEGCCTLTCILLSILVMQLVVCIVLSLDI